MELSTVEIPRDQAREAAADYLREAKRISDPVARAEFEEIARAYRAASASEVPLIALTPTLEAGGTMVRTRKNWNDTAEDYLLPRLAVCRADSRYVYTKGVERDGSISFCDRLSPSSTLVKGRIHLDTSFEIDTQRFTAGEELRTWENRAWGAMVPIVPPKHRPPRASALRTFTILWEADDWQWTEGPRPPRDPALLRHVAGDIYAVLAVWDLTELERLVLAGRRPE